MSLQKLRDTKMRLSRFVPTAHWETWSNLVAFSLAFPRYPKKESSVRAWRKMCRCGKGHLCHKNCPGFEVWMSGAKPLGNLERSFVRISNRSIEGGVTAFGFTIKAFLRISLGGTTCSSNGLGWMLVTPATCPSNATSFFTWQLARLTAVVSASFTLSVAALVILTSAPLYLLTRLLKSKTSYSVSSRRQVRTHRKTYL